MAKTIQIRTSRLSYLDQGWVRQKREEIERLNRAHEYRPEANVFSEVALRRIPAATSIRIGPRDRSSFSDRLRKTKSIKTRWDEHVFLCGIQRHARPRNDGWHYGLAATNSNSSETTRAATPGVFRSSRFQLKSRCRPRQVSFAGPLHLQSTVCPSLTRSRTMAGRIPISLGNWMNLVGIAAAPTTTTITCLPFILKKLLELANLSPTHWMDIQFWVSSPKTKPGFPNLTI